MIAEKFANAILVSDGDKELRELLLIEYYPHLEWSCNLDPQWFFVFADESAVWLDSAHDENVLHVFDNVDDAILYGLKYPRFIALFGEENASTTAC